VDVVRLRQELCAFLGAEVLGTGLPVDEDAVLADLGVDSFSVMELVLFLERRFGVILPMDRLTPDALRSVRTLAATVACAASPGGPG